MMPRAAPPRVSAIEVDFKFRRKEPLNDLELSFSPSFSRRTPRTMSASVECNGDSTARHECLARLCWIQTCQPERRPSPLQL